MDSIKQALDLVKSSDAVLQETGASLHDVGLAADVDSTIRRVELNKAHLEAARIVAHRSVGQGLYYDVLRTQILQEMDRNGWQFLGVAGPRRDSGATLTACNLAMSLARLPGRSVALIDMDLQQPSIAKNLGLKGSVGLPEVLGDNLAISDALISASIGPLSLVVLAGDPAVKISSDWMASQTAYNLFEAIRRELRSRIVIFDLPPLLSGDDVIWILPRLDAVVLVAGVGSTTVSEISDCGKYLEDTPVIRVVVNKVTNSS